ncbi:hypothetical protein K505DRAFT_336907 [Melanomma pulvis-pyrius CBS 109.77]|uniref:Uncharacterized protein n=1 Tax=Melanomma pulvis-pyrius CBS 109.77 TaxID=1314802 RepID=A0A6A6XEX5_9PLEO|nr:hypothetical protein K505DRAFT_336907 [Melanomma pulvis-pyrius CBS 109.77]
MYDILRRRGDVTCVIDENKERVYRNILFGADKCRPELDGPGECGWEEQESDESDSDDEDMGGWHAYDVEYGCTENIYWLFRAGQVVHGTDSDQIPNDKDYERPRKSR